ncbi:hypothetical protein ACFSJ3_00320 [Corallincola platygyrae]|uniref:Uncharacterized protein n=1 Tax=Corallincola platygyrae TaxID=1193278 RepID=A0ABW4XG12_9GAMM
MNRGWALWLMSLLWTSTFLQAETLTDPHKNFTTYTAQPDAAAKLAFLSKADMAMIDTLSSGSEHYYEYYRSFVIDNFNRAKFQADLAEFEKMELTNQQGHLVGLFYAMITQYEFFYGKTISDEATYMLTTIASTESPTEQRAREYFATSCNSGWLIACFTYFNAVNTQVIPCITGYQLKACSQTMHDLAEAEQMYLDTAILNYELAAKEESSERFGLAGIIAQIYRAGITGIVTVEDYPDWIRDYPFPRDSAKSAHWLKLAQPVQ